MKENKKERNVEISGFDAPIEKFTIANNAKAFKILSDNLYSDKISAVIRELSCNALDAHVSIGNKHKPFDIHLPNNFEPFFYIRDYGTGLSEESIYSVYTTFFKSTKSEENDSIGMLGLGSKSPLSYVDQFTVENFYNGKKFTYNVFKAEDGTPSIIKIMTEDTTEPNGLKVQLMVERNDFNAFAERARKIFYRYDTPPNITGNKVDLTKVVYDMVGPNFKLRNRESDEIYRYGDHDYCYAIQGTVAYPIKESNFTLELTDTQKSILRRNPLDIEFAIGLIDVAPSREELSYDKITQQNIINAIDKIIAYVPQFVEAEMKACATEWEARSSYDKFCSKNSRVSELVKNVVDDIGFKWKNKTINSSRLPINLYDRKLAIKNHPKDFKDDVRDSYGASIKITNRLGEKLTKHNIARYGTCIKYGEYDINNRVKPRGDVLDLEMEIPTSESTQIVILDDPKIERRLVSYILHNYKGKNKAVYIFKVASAFHKAIEKQLGDCPFISYAKDLEPPAGVGPDGVKADGTKSEVRTLYKVKSIGSGGYGESPIIYEAVNYDVTLGGVFIVNYSNTPIHPGFEFDEKSMAANNGSSDLWDLFKLASGFKFYEDIKDKIYSFNSSKTGSLKNNLASWTSLYSHIKVKVEAILADKKLLETYQAHEDLHSHLDSYHNLIQWKSELKKLDIHKTNSEFLKFMKYVDTISTGIESFAKLSKGADFNITINNHYSPKINELLVVSNKILKTKEYKPKAKSGVEAKVCKFRAKYPMLEKILANFSIVDNYRNDANMNRKYIAHYINLCDATPITVTKF